MKVLIVLNDPPYGTERSYNGLRLARQLATTDDVEVALFLMADAVSCAKGGQKTPNGYYNLECMLRSLARIDVPIGACGTCTAACGLVETDLIDGVHASTMDELGRWTLESDRTVVF